MNIIYEKLDRLTPKKLEAAIEGKTYQPLQQKALELLREGKMTYINYMKFCVRHGLLPF